MKRILLHILCFSIGFTSCTHEEFLQGDEQTLPIRFSSQCVGISTRTPGVIYGNILPENSQVSLFSLQHPINTPPAKWLPELFNNTIGIADSKGDILYDNTYYFPVGEELDFFAINPSLHELGATYSDTKTIDIQLKENASEQLDLMYASLLNQSKKTPTLVLEFNHLLSQITFQIIQGNSVIIDLPLTKIELKAPQTGTFNLWTGELTTQTDQTTLYTLDTHTSIANQTLIPGQFLLFPEKASEIILTFGTDGTHIYHITPSEEPYAWEAGKSYQYNITINKDIVDETIPVIDPSTSTDTPPTEDPTSADTTDNTKTNPTDSDSSSSTDETVAGKEEMINSSPENTASEGTEEAAKENQSTDSLESTDTADKHTDMQTKTQTLFTPDFIIINLSLD